MLRSLVSIVALSFTGALVGVRAQTFTPQPQGSPEAVAAFNQVVDKTIARENSLTARLKTMRPVAETYVQEMQKDPDRGFIPVTDHYFLGKVDLSQGVATESLIGKGGGNFFLDIFTTRFLQRGFAQMMILDGGGFDRAHYNFQFLRREFLGDVRTWVIAVSPTASAGNGRFDGRIWVEDKTDSIVRFNGTYGKGLKQHYLHFDSWRVNCGPDLWMPAEIYSEETELPTDFGFRKMHYKALTQLWGYTTALDRDTSEFTSVTVEMPSVQDHSEQAADFSPVEGLRNWKHESEDNVLNRLERGNLLAPSGEVEKILDTVVNNLIVTNNLQIVPAVRTRVLLSTPLDTFTIGNTIVISRGLLDTLPDEASLAAMLAHELAHIALGHGVDTKFAFADQTNVDDQKMLQRFRFVRPQFQEDEANKKGLELLQNSPYKDKLKQAGLFLTALDKESTRLPHLIQPLTGNRIAEKNHVLRMAELLQGAPELQVTRTDQTAALPLGSRTRLDPWTDRLRMARLRTVPLLSAGEKMPFEVAPVYIHLTYEGQPETAPVTAAAPAAVAPAAPSNNASAASPQRQQ